jgi:TolA-binding protein
MQGKRYGVCALAIVAAIAGVMFSACSGGSSTLPALPSASEVMQKQVASLQASNDSLQGQVTKLEQEKQALAARVRDLQKQIDTLSSQPPPPAAEAKPVTREVHGSYQDALAAFRSRNFEDAAAMFQQVLDAGVEKGLADNCTYWIGECLFGEKKYDAAIAQFEKVFDFEWSNKKDDAQIMIANAYLAKGDKVKAKEEYQQLLKKFPASPFVKRAKAKLSTL